MFRPYPGMIDHSVEFFTHDDQLKFLQNGTTKSFSELPFATIQVIDEYIESEPEVKAALLQMHPNSQIARTEQLAKCRWTGLDFQADIKNGVLQDGEWWPCPNRGTCPHEGVLCKMPVYNGNRLTMRDVKLLQLMATDKTNEVIAEEMELPMGTFNQLKKNLYQRLGNLQTKQGATIVAQLLALI